MLAVELSRPFTDPDYNDRFILRTRSTTFDDIDVFVRALALNQPRWLTGISMGIRDRAAVAAAVGDTPLAPGNAIGNWEVVDRGPTHVTFAEDMGIMAYRISYRWGDAHEITAETEVVQQTRWFGPIYWALATPLHKRFLTRMLANAAADPDATVNEATAP